jgi:hypothetical protein
VFDGQADNYNLVGHGGTAISTSDTLLNSISSMAGPFFCPVEVEIYWNSSEAGSITVKQHELVTWRWDASNEFDTHSPEARGLAGAFATVEPSRSGSFSYSFSKLGLYSYTDGVDGSGLEAAIRIVDADECAGEGQNTCSSTSTVCHNTAGGFDCLDKCTLPHSGDQCADDAQTCTAMGSDSACVCPTGYSGSNVCSDVDECRLDIDACDHTCSNSRGGFVCLVGKIS